MRTIMVAIPLLALAACNVSKGDNSVTVQYEPTAAGSTESATLAASSKKPPATASALLTGKTNSSECDSFNDQPFFNRLYGSLGTNGTFAAGDVLTLSAGGPEDPGPFPTTQIILSVDGSLAASAPSLEAPSCTRLQRTVFIRSSGTRMQGA